MALIETKWLIEAPQQMLATAIDHAGLDPNALRILIGQENEGALIYPSFFATPEAWMRALAHLVTRHVNFRIFLTDVTGEHGGREVGRARVYPRFDTETSELLASIDLDESRLLKLIRSGSRPLWPRCANTPIRWNRQPPPICYDRYPTLSPPPKWTQPPMCWTAPRAPLTR